MKTAGECHGEKGPLLVALMDVNWKCEILSLSNKEKFGPPAPPPQNGNSHPCPLIV